jgi:hypothetical protein
VAGLVAYVMAIETTFGSAIWARTRIGPVEGPIIMIAITSVAGLCAIAIGYCLIRAFGLVSMSLARLLARVTHSKQIIEISEESSNRRGMRRILDRIHWAYLPALMFISSLALGWDIYGADSSGSSMLQPILRELDIFYNPAGKSALFVSRHIIVSLLVITVLAGIAPAIAIPYFVRFKITGINSGPFHTSLLFFTVGAVVGLSMIFTLGGLLYNSFLASDAPLPYHFGILAILGYSIHFSLGLSIGERKTQVQILKRIQKSETGRLVLN